MTAIYLLIPISLLFLAIAIVAFVWASRARQFDDLDSPALSILLDDEHATGPKQSATATVSTPTTSPITGTTPDEPSTAAGPRHD